MERNPERFHVQHHRHPNLQGRDDWRESHSFGPGELPTVAKVMLDAHAWVQEQMASEQNGQNRLRERHISAHHGLEPIAEVQDEPAAPVPVLGEPGGFTWVG